MNTQDKCVPSRPTTFPNAWESPTTHMAFMRQNLPLLAAMAYERYLAEGRGTILVSSLFAWTAPIWKQGQTGVMYMSETVIRELKRGWPDPELKRMVKAYDPEREVVITFERLDGGLSYYRFGSVPLTPSEAYTVFKAELVAITLSQQEVIEFIRRMTQ